MMAAGKEYHHVTLLIFITNNFLRESVVQVKYATEKEVIEQSPSHSSTHLLASTGKIHKKTRVESSQLQLRVKDDDEEKKK